MLKELAVAGIYTEKQISNLSFSDRRIPPQKCEGVKHQF
ncbi:hypothetical protein DJ93_5684 [Bacillus clarus]|uniref:Uncharacterized protein n=1 Tax=Bacillus clarus TaxID=2338372 RepID=A0A090YT08_9BACI|nr:hypothetical protein DJ93_5684 [Bacillus clarus]